MALACLWAFSVGVSPSASAGVSQVAVRTASAGFSPAAADADVAAALRGLHIARMTLFAERDGVRIGPSPGKGFGVFATRRLVSFEKVGDYVGERLSQRDVDVRYRPQSSADTAADTAWRQSRERRGVGCTGRFLFKIADHLFVDSEDPSFATWTRYLNHGEPNLRVKSLEKGYDGKPRVWFVATCDIAPGEELLWDYGEDYWCVLSPFPLSRPEQAPG